MIARKLLTVLFSVSILFSSALQAEDEMWEYELVEGDTLWEISHNFLKDWRLWQKLQSLNKVAFDRKMVPGTRISIPVEWLDMKSAPVEVLKTSGDVTIFDPQGNVQAIDDSLRIETGYSVETGPSSSALLLFADGSKLVVQQDTRIEFNTTSTVGSGLVFNYEIGLPQGKVENRANPNRTPGSTFLIETPSSVTATRGTIYRVNTDGIKTGTEVTDGKVAVENDLGEVPVEKGFGVITEKGKPPSAPVKLLPAPALDQFMGRFAYIPANLSWPMVKGAKAYLVQLSLDDSFDLIAHEFTTDTTVATLPLSLANGEYFARIRAIDTLGLEGNDAVSKFEYGQKPLSPLHVLNGQQPLFGADEVVLRWSQSVGAQAYIIQVTPKEDEGNIVSRSLVSDATEYRPRLKPGKYGWRLQVVEQDGSISEFGHESEFTVVDTAYLQKDEPLNSVFHMPYAPVDKQLRLQVAKDPDFTQLVSEQRAKGNKLELASKLGSGAYFVRYQVLNKNDSVTDTSPVYSIEL